MSSQRCCLYLVHRFLRMGFCTLCRSSLHRLLPPTSCGSINTFQGLRHNLCSCPVNRGLGSWEKGQGQEAQVPESNLCSFPSASSIVLGITETGPEVCALHSPLGICNSSHPPFLEVIPLRVCGLSRFWRPYAFTSIQVAV